MSAAPLPSPLLPVHLIVVVIVTPLVLRDAPAPLLGRSLGLSPSLYFPPSLARSPSLLCNTSLASTLLTSPSSPVEHERAESSASRDEAQGRGSSARRTRPAHGRGCSSSRLLVAQTVRLLRALQRTSERSRPSHSASKSSRAEQQTLNPLGLLYSRPLSLAPTRLFQLFQNLELARRSPWQLDDRCNCSRRPARAPRRRRQRPGRAPLTTAPF